MSNERESGNDGAPARSAARLAAVQALYQMETTGLGVEAVIAEFVDHRIGGELEGAAMHVADKHFFSDILRGTVEVQSRLDVFIENQLAEGWTLKRIDSIARAILRAGLFELVRRADVPARVIINEYLEVAHAFFEGDEPKFINGVLDRAAKQARDDEFTA